MVITFPVSTRRAHEARGRELPESEFRTDSVRVSAVTAMSPVLDDLSLKFAMWAGQTGKTCLDVGCGAGLASRRGARPRGARRCRRSGPCAAAAVAGERSGTAVRAAGGAHRRTPGAGFQAVRICRGARGTRPAPARWAGIRDSLAKFFRWLYPHGRLFVSALTPLGSFWQRFQPEYIRRATAGSGWPGYIEDLSQFSRHGKKGRPLSSARREPVESGNADGGLRNRKYPTLQPPLGARADLLQCHCTLYPVIPASPGEH